MCDILTRVRSAVFPSAAQESILHGFQKDLTLTCIFACVPCVTDMIDGAIMIAPSHAPVRSLESGSEETNGIGGGRGQEMEGEGERPQKQNKTNTIFPDLSLHNQSVGLELEKHAHCTQNVHLPSRVERAGGFVEDELGCLDEPADPYSSTYPSNTPGHCGAGHMWRGERVVLGRPAEEGREGLDL
ncbi:hypothetical protein BCR34DRAFT_357437 [Clohesyomyces aquaticus]|uniref:Uncharacterized protein n=1 Tax=Clohesyomyces aquaticus TaxID=1231657 RepID=A0A1Y1ZIM8_9PLEO|nr:hypothetical protein BCR34DRAFT_357437 [Clohesyomyces aquaticus]